MGALEGIRVIDFGQYIAGPLTAMFLADQGADVIRIDPPGGPAWDVPANATWNRGKRSIVLDLKQAGDLATARALVATADVLIENFRPGVMDRLGLGPEAMMTANPRLLYCSLPGFAADDPRAAIPAWEGVVAAAGGVHARRERPIFTAIPISSTYAAFLGATSIAMALSARGRDGVGQRIEMPLYDANFTAMGYQGQRIHNGPPPPDADARNARQMGVGGQLQCKDGRWVMYMGGNLNARDFLEATGAAKWVDEGLPPEELRKRTEELFLTRTAQEWETFSAEIGTECAVCRTSAEWLQDPGAIDSRIVLDVDDPKLGKVREAGIGVRMTATPLAIRSPRHRTDADRAEILSEIASRRQQAPAARVDSTFKAALDGIKVLDLCIVLAGPTCGRTLAEFGADVIKIDSPSRQAVAFHNDINRGKRSIVLDLKSEEGMSIFWRLVADADVVVQNFRKGVADRLGIGYEAVRARKPDIVYASLNAYGQVGSYSGRPGHEQIAQAATGMQERFGGGGRPTLQPYAVNDYGTGLMGAYGVALALFHRQQTGQGQHVSTSLADTACALQSMYLQDYAGKTWDEPRGQDALGSGPLNRLYCANDGWFFFAAPESLLPALERVPGLQGIGAAKGKALEALLEERFAAASADEWSARLLAAGAGAHRVTTSGQMMTDPWAREHGLSVTREHDGIGLMTHIGPSPRLSRTPAQPGRPTPPPGADAASILAEIGRAGDLDRLVESKIIVTEGILAR
jgi:crotonobetainyl-CoA:carnitine CoA-transferase CaiB-like acyl-CoA transferase